MFPETQHHSIQLVGEGCPDFSDDDDRVPEPSIVDVLDGIVTKLSEMILTDDRWGVEVREYLHDVANRLKQWKCSVLWISQDSTGVVSAFMNANQDDRLRILLEEVHHLRPFLSSMIRGHLDDVDGCISALSIAVEHTETSESLTIILDELEQSLEYFGLQIEPLGTFVHMRTLKREGLLNETRAGTTASPVTSDTQNKHDVRPDFDKQDNSGHHIDLPENLHKEVFILPKDKKSASNTEPVQRLAIRSSIPDEISQDLMLPNPGRYSFRKNKPSVGDHMPSQSLKATTYGSKDSAKRSFVAESGQNPLSVGAERSDQGAILWSTQYGRYFRQFFDKATRQWVTQWLPVVEHDTRNQNLHERTGSHDNSHVGISQTRNKRQEILKWKMEVDGKYQLIPGHDEDTDAVHGRLPTMSKLELETTGVGSSLVDVESSIGSATSWNNENTQPLYIQDTSAGSLLQKQSYRPSSLNMVQPQAVSDTGAESDIRKGLGSSQQQASLYQASQSGIRSSMTKHNQPYDNYFEHAVSSTESILSMPRGRGAQLVSSNTSSTGSSLTESVDPSFRRRKVNWFIDGRVFAVVINETAGQDALAHLASSTQNINPVRFKDNRVHTQVRRFVVVRRKKEFCYACPIFTYGFQATTKRGVRPEEHGIIYSDGQQPLLVTGETGITKKSIRVKMTKGVANLHYASRVYYGIHHPIQQNIRVKDIGQVAQSHMPALIGNWKAEDGKESTGISGHIAEEAGEASTSHQPPNQPDPDLYHPTENIYGYDKVQNPDMYHPTYNPYGYHPSKNKVGYHPQSSFFSYHPQHNPYGYHPQRAPFCYHPVFSPFGYHSTENPIGYHPVTMQYNYHPQANEHGYHEDHNPYGYQPTMHPGGYHPSVNPDAYHPEHNPCGLHERQRR